MKLFRLVFYVIITLICVGTVIMVYGVEDEGLRKATLESGGSNLGLIGAYILFAIAIGSAIIFPVAYLIKHPETAKRQLMSLGVLVVVFLVSYFLASGEVLDSYAPFNVTTVFQSKMIGGGLIFTYILGGASIVFAIYYEIVRLLK